MRRHDGGDATGTADGQLSVEESPSSTPVSRAVLLSVVRMSAKAAATAARRSRDAPPADMLKDVAGSSQLRDLFLKYDDDNSGGIDADELEHIFVDVGEATTRRELDDLVRDFGAPCDDGEAGEFSVDFDGFCKMMVFLQRRGRLGGLFDFDACAGLSSVLAEGENVVEREGITLRHPCKPLLIATFNPEEGALREHLLDRIAVTLSADQVLTFDDRVLAVDQAMNFQNSADKAVADAEEATEGARTQIILAREWLKECEISEEQIGYLVGEATRGVCMGHRAELFAVKAAKALAALDGRLQLGLPDAHVRFLHLPHRERLLHLVGVLRRRRHVVRRLPNVRHRQPLGGRRELGVEVGELLPQLGLPLLRLRAGGLRLLDARRRHPRRQGRGRGR